MSSFNANTVAVAGLDSGSGIVLSTIRGFESAMAQGYGGWNRWRIEDKFGGHDVYAYPAYRGQPGDGLTCGISLVDCRTLILTSRWFRVKEVMSPAHR